MEKGEVIVKNAEVLKMLLLHRYDPKLVEILFYVAEKYGLCITEGFREPRHAGDVHSTDPVRAVDLRHWIYGTGVAATIEADVNARWMYDPDRPCKRCAMIHSVDGGAVHMHIQTHPRTGRI